MCKKTFDIINLCGQRAVRLRLPEGEKPVKQRLLACLGPAQTTLQQISLSPEDHQCNQFGTLNLDTCRISGGNPAGILGG